MITCSSPYLSPISLSSNIPVSMTYGRERITWVEYHFTYYIWCFSPCSRQWLRCLRSNSVMNLCTVNPQTITSGSPEGIHLTTFPPARFKPSFMLDWVCVWVWLEIQNIPFYYRMVLVRIYTDCTYSGRALVSPHINLQSFSRITIRAETFPWDPSLPNMRIWTLYKTPLPCQKSAPWHGEKNC